MKETIYNLEKKKVGECELSEEIFGGKVNKALLYEAVRMQLTNRRQGDAASKTRSEVSGSTRKIYRQKGTGRARHSDRHANIFVGGGKSFGPHQRDYSYAIPVKERRAALRSALTAKYKDGNILIVESLATKEPKTALMADALEKLGVNAVLLVADKIDDNMKRSVRNIPNVKLVKNDSLNTYDVLKYEHLVITQSAIAKVQEILKP